MRPTVILELPLNKHTRVLRPEQVILKIADRYFDVGAFCYALRSDKNRKRRQPREVVTGSLIKQRPKQILQLIKTLSTFVNSVGRSLETVGSYAANIGRFLDWTDANATHDCLAGREATLSAFRDWATHVHERYRRHELSDRSHNIRLQAVCEVLEATTGVENVMQGIRIVQQRTNPNGGTEPIALSDFAHAVAINQCLFDGLCDLVLDQRPFPYRLDLPGTLGWEENHLWLFPTSMWRRAPHMQDDAIRVQQGPNAAWPYDYKNGRLATVDEIEDRYSGRTKSERRKSAKHSLARARARLEKANADALDNWRLTLGMAAQRAFLFLFFCNSGSNGQVVRDLESDGTINATAQKQHFRTLKWRAGGKEVTLHMPAAFMPRLRRFMELRQYLLQGRRTPYLFFGCGNRNNAQPARIRDFELDQHYRHVLTEIDPKLPKMGQRALRASVDDYYVRLTDPVVAAAVMGHTVATETKKYAAGSANDHHREMTVFMAAVSESARRQRVVLSRNATLNATPLEQGGRCDSYGRPEALAADVPIEPDCKDSQGCLFCHHRVLIADEDDARKVASAAYVMEQLIFGPRHEEALRPLITKCDEDLERIAAFGNRRDMVENVRKDVFENENLTPFWADKYNLFLELGILS